MNSAQINLSTEMTPGQNQSCAEYKAPSLNEGKPLVIIMKAATDALDAENRRLAEMARIEAKNRAAQQEKLDAIAVQKAKEKISADERSQLAKQALQDAKEKAKAEAKAKSEAQAAEKARTEAEFQAIKIANETALAEKQALKILEVKKAKEKAIEQLIDNFAMQLNGLSEDNVVSKYTVNRILKAIGVRSRR